MHFSCLCSYFKCRAASMSTCPFLHPRPTSLNCLRPSAPPRRLLSPPRPNKHVRFPQPAPRLRRADSAAQGAGAGRSKPVQPASQAQAACQAAREDLGTGGHRRHTKPRAAPRQALHAGAVHPRAHSCGDAVPDALLTGRPAGLRHPRRHAPSPTREQAAARTLTLTLEPTVGRSRAR